jgi:hypothetical protein
LDVERWTLSVENQSPLLALRVTRPTGRTGVLMGR